MGNMKKELYDYFVNLNNLDLQKEKNAFLVSDPKIKKYKQPYRLAMNVDYYKVDSNPFFAKNWNGVYSVFDIASSRMYNEIGILTPPEFVMINPKNTNSPYSYNGYLYIITQDIHKLPNIKNAIMPYNLNKFQYVHWNYPDNTNMDILTNKQLREELLGFMTESCLDELCNIILADEIRTETDRHLRNLFLYKSDSSAKYEGVLAIDNEMGAVCIYSELPFSQFIKKPYSSASLVGYTNDASYVERIKAIRQLISIDKLSSSQLQLIKDELTFDLPKEVKKICNELDIKNKYYNKNFYDATANLWDLNRRTIGKDLEM